MLFGRKNVIINIKYWNPYLMVGFSKREKRQKDETNWISKTKRNEMSLCEWSIDWLFVSFWNCLMKFESTISKWTKTHKNDEIVSISRSDGLTWSHDLWMRMSLTKWDFEDENTNESGTQTSHLSGHSWGFRSIRHDERTWETNEKMSEQKRNGNEERNRKDTEQTVSHCLS